MAAVGLTADSFQKGPPDEIFFVEDIFEIVQCLLVCLGQFYPKNLFGVIPFVNGRVGVKAFVTLQPNEASVQSLAQDLGKLRFAHARLTFQKQWLSHLESQVDDGGKPAIADILLLF